MFLLDVLPGPLITVVWEFVDVLERCGDIVRVSAVETVLIESVSLYNDVVSISNPLSSTRESVETSGPMVYALVNCC